MRVVPVKPKMLLQSDECGTWKVWPRTSAWSYLYVEATRRNLILPDLPGIPCQVSIVKPKISVVGAPYNESAVTCVGFVEEKYSRKSEIT